MVSSTFSPQLGSSVGQIILNPNLEEEINGSDEMSATLQTIVDMASEYAQNIAPTRSGDMVGSINGFLQSDASGLVGIVEVGTDHWMFVEYGTGIRGAASDQPTPGLPQGYEHGVVAGQQAQPFMRTTLWWLRNQVGD